jgi:glycosyltransferase involved in cell wall biosynthesis
MHVLHVATEVYSGGGHSAFITRWIDATKASSSHSLITTNSSNALPEELFWAIEESGGWHLSLPAMTQTLVERALLLRHLADSWADIVVLTVHPFDTLPTVAFGVEGGPPVLFCNHADHQFWVGASIIDVPVEYHASGGLVSNNRRGIRDSQVLPIPLPKTISNPAKPETAKEKLGLKNNEMMLLTVAREEKYLPYDGVDFFDVMVKFLKLHTDLKLFAAGPAPQGRWIEASTLTNGCIKALGPLDRQHLNELFDAADVYVSSFPCSSATAMLEAGLHGVPLVGLQNREMPHLTGQDDVAFEGLPIYAASVEEMFAFLEALIENRSYSKEWAIKAQKRIENTHRPPVWNRYLDKILQSLPSKHKIRILPQLNGELDYSDHYLAYLNSKMLSDELVEHTFARLIRVVYANHLSRKDCFNLQARALCEALPKIKSKSKAKEYLYNFREFLVQT